MSMLRRKTQVFIMKIENWHVRKETPRTSQTTLQITFTLWDAAFLLTRSNLSKHLKSCLLSIQQVQALLILFSKYFSHFPHGTCLLSVSITCSRLHEIYHSLCTPVPRSVILKVHTVHRELQMTNGILTLIDAFFPKGLHLHLYWQCIPNLHFKGIAPNFQAEHFLFHSQLLKKSNFVSFPPLTYMLKFSRFGCLNSRHAM